MGARGTGAFRGTFLAGRKQGNRSRKQRALASGTCPETVRHLLIVISVDGCQSISSFNLRCALLPRGILYAVGNSEWSLLVDKK